MLTAEQINNALDVEVVQVCVPEWHGDVYVRTIDLNEHKALMKTLHGAQKDDHDHMLLLIAMTLCQSQGERLYDWTNPDHLKLLAKRRVAVLQRCYDAAAKLNLLQDDEDDLVGKSEAGQTSDSVSG